MAPLHAEHPDRFDYFASLPLPDVGTAIAETRHTAGLDGCAGVCIETNAHGTYLDDPGPLPLRNELDRRRSVVFIHPTSPAGFDPTQMGMPKPLLEFLFDSTRTVIALAARRRSLSPHSLTTCGAPARPYRRRRPLRRRPSGAAPPLPRSQSLTGRRLLLTRPPSSDGCSRSRNPTLTACSPAETLVVYLSSQ
ncbi:putative hydrolase [Gordonia polyisoprenivorans NBRC 16320 = JCM 10675]|nr:putative hydrolase [Gordonia polyisoprenivorans NBRC 16320 = JCM 10675]